MFNEIGWGEILVLLVAAIFIFGPDRLPDVARQAGRMVRTVRQMATNARTQLADELGPEFADLDLRDLNPKALVQKHLFDDLDDETPQRLGHQPLDKGESAPYDVEAT
ncbi:MAG: sec-independent translocase [Nocardioidaceae bacterium]